MILLPMFEEEDEVYVVALGMDVKTTYPCYSRRRETRRCGEKDDYGKWKCNAFLVPLRHICAMFWFLCYSTIKSCCNAHTRDFTYKKPAISLLWYCMFCKESINQIELSYVVR